MAIADVSAGSIVTLGTWTVTTGSNVSCTVEYSSSKISVLSALSKYSTSDGITISRADGGAITTSPTYTRSSTEYYLAIRQSSTSSTVTFSAVLGLQVEDLSSTSITLVPTDTIEFFGINISVYAA